jgi:hypothetical protein
MPRTRRFGLQANGMNVSVAILAVAAIVASPADKKNPTCPATPDWTSNRTMQLTFTQQGQSRVLLAEGAIDAGLISRLNSAFKKYKPIDEIWLRSPGGDAKIGNEAGLLIRKVGVATRIPAGWACFSACNFVFMGGVARTVDPAGVFMVHMFTFTADGGILAQEVGQGYDQAVQGIAQVEQDAALLASQDNDFLIRAGVSRKLLTEVMYRQKAVAGRGTDQSTRRCLTKAELRKYNVTNAD